MPSTGAPSLATLSPRAVAGILAGIKLVIHLATLKGYGYFRDELYYIACSERLSLGYVDHPPLSVALLKLVRLGFGDSVSAIRLLPAIAGALVVLFTGLLALELGGGRLAVALAGLGVLVAPPFLGVAHVYSIRRPRARRSGARRASRPSRRS